MYTRARCPLHPPCRPGSSDSLVAFGLTSSQPETHCGPCYKPRRTRWRLRPTRGLQDRGHKCTGRSARTEWKASGDGRHSRVVGTTSAFYPTGQDTQACRSMVRRFGVPECAGRASVRGFACGDARAPQNPRGVPSPARPLLLHRQPTMCRDPQSLPPVAWHCIRRLRVALSIELLHRRASSGCELRRSQPFHSARTAATLRTCAACSTG